MHQIAEAKSDRAVEIAPSLRHVVPWRVVSVEALPGQRLYVVFVDGTSGEVHLQGFLADPGVEGTVFEALRDEEFFNQVQVAMGAIQWPDGADLAPDAMYDAIREKGHWVPETAEPD